MSHLWPKRMTMNRRRAVLLLSLAALALAGCGYGVHVLYRQDIKTIYVEFFGNDTYRRRLEISLTQGVVAEIKLRTPLTFAPRAEADSVLSGTITEADVSTVVKNARANVLLQRAQVQVRFRWRDRLTGRDIVPEQVVAGNALVPVTPVEGIFEGSPDQTAVFALALQEVARRIVENMEQSW